MKIAVISDLHLGAGDAADAFGHSDADFLRFLRFLESNFEHIVLLGDIWEALTPRNYGQFAQALKEAREAHPSIARRFERPQYTYVHGNHDLVAGAVDKAPDMIVLGDRSTRILFTHGHHHDVLIQRAPWLTEVGVWFGGWLRRLGGHALYRLLNRLEAMRYRLHADPSACGFQRWAVGLGHVHRSDVVVTGHTHLATRSEHRNQLFMNSGSCSGGHFSFLSLDTSRGDYAVNATW